MSQLLVQNYLNEIDRLRRYTGSVTEGVISEAFKDLLKAWSRQLNWQFSAQYEFATTQRSRIRPDGTIFHSIGLPFGYWEAKDTADDLDVEIARKLARGYPQDNIIFENSDVAVLIQDRREVFRCPMKDTEALLKLLTLFFGYEREAIREFRKAVEEFRHKLPFVLEELRRRIDTAYAQNAGFRAEADRFLEHCKDTINPTLGEADVREMLIQHVLTEEIFSSVFNEGDFHHENNIAKLLYALEEKFFTRQVKKETMAGLNPYYAAIKSNAANITDHAGKQTFLKVIYENFYKVYDAKKADRLGVVYTPNEIVKFMIEGADWLTQKHFGKALIDEHVEILDPATGTGTFICELLEHFRGQPQKLAHKYRNELHANEVAILPYYVANLNIEATYAAITGQFAEFPNLCFVDTLDNVAGLGIKAGFQHDMFAGVSEENVARVKRQNARKISVVIGNPPYNANQQNENENNKNRTYPRIDELIKSSYIRLSTAQKTKVYDMYARFFRWASDRLHDDGVLAFVTNRSFIDSRTFDGFRRAVEQEFNEIYVMDLGGDVRANPRLSGTKHNVFGIQTGVAISFMVKRRKQKGCRVFYARRPELDTAADKLAFLGSSPASGIAWQRVEPDKNANWVNLTENDWDEFLPVVDKTTKTAGSKSKERAVFGLFSLGVVTARDQWVYDQSPICLENKVRHFVAIYESERMRWKNADKSAGTGNWVNREIKWARELERFMRNDTSVTYESRKIRPAAYRPFVKLLTYYDRVLTHCIYQQDAIFPLDREVANTLITFSDPAAQKPWMTLGVSALPDLHFVGPAAGTVCAPRYRYTPTGERVDNVTDWALKQFRDAYAKGGRGAAAAISPLEGGPEDGRDERLAPGGSPEGGVQAPGAPQGGVSRGLDGSSEAPPSVLPDISPSRGEIGRSPAAPSRGEIGSAAAHPAEPPPPPAPPRKGEGSRAADAGGGAEGGRRITKDDIFHYVYAVLHDPVYRERYAINLKRAFPRIPFYPDFWRWAEWGKRLMALHIGYEQVEPWPLTRIDTPDEKARAAGVAPKAMLKADRGDGPHGGIIRLDSETVLSGIPAAAWDYRLGNRSGLEWILDQYKEKTPKDPTIREKFNTYRFADYKEKVADLLMRVTRVSVETVAVTEAMREARR